MNRIMVIAPHPDDETLGCGGALLKLKKDGKKIFWVIITNILAGQGYSDREVLDRQKEIEKVTGIYQFNGVHKLNLPTAMLDTIPMNDIIQPLHKVINEFEPDTVFLPCYSDVHSDHRITFDATISCTKVFRAPFIKRLFMYEVISETDFSPPVPSRVFSPNNFCDISGFIEEKIKIMNIFKGEIKNSPFPRSEESIRALAKIRGHLAGCHYAESFQTLKEIW